MSVLSLSYACITKGQEKSEEKQRTQRTLPSPLMVELIISHIETALAYVA